LARAKDLLVWGVFPDRIDAKFTLASAHPYPTGVIGLSYTKS